MTNVKYLAQEKSLENLTNSSTSEEAANDLYVKYISERPNSNGLFGNIDVSDIQRVANNLAALTGEGRNIYRGIVSLSGEDAIELGYTKKEKWVQFIHATIPDVAAQFDIPIDELQWTAAVHMEKTHPHCHYMFWSSKDRVSSPYIHVSIQDKCREILSKEMFKEEREREIIDKTFIREKIVKDVKELIYNEKQINVNNDSPVAGRIDHNTLSELGQKLYSLAAVLPESGRLNYKFLSKDDKLVVDKFVDENILSNRVLNKEYNKFLTSVDNISRTYSASDKHTKINRDIAIEDIKKRIANCILKECRDIQNNQSNILDIIRHTEVYKDINDRPEDSIIESDHADRGADIDFKYAYTNNYKKALKLLYEQKEIPQALELLQIESEQNNVLAHMELGKLYERNLVAGLTKDESDKLSYSYYEKVFNGLLVLSAKDNKPAYNYKLGKLYEKGNGTNIDYEAARSCYEKAAASKYKYAQYSLGNMYLYGNIVPLTSDNKKEVFKTGLDYIKQAADNDFGFAAYKYASTMEREFAGQVQSDTLYNYYAQAFSFFKSSLKERKDDFTLYRLGTMYYEGKGTDIDYEAAHDCFKQSAELNNALAQYALGKTYSDPESKYYDIDNAIKYFTLSADNNNLYSYLALGDLYSNANLSVYNIEKALSCYKEALNNNVSKAALKLGKLYANKESNLYDLFLAENYLLKAYKHGDNAAAYSLGKLYCDSDSSLYDSTKGIEYLKYAADQGDKYALAKLGNIYLFGTCPDVPKNVELGKEYLKRSIELGNEFAETSYAIYEDIENNIKFNLYLDAGYNCFNSIFSSMVRKRNETKELDDLRKYRSKSKAAKKAALTKKGIVLHPNQ